MAHFAIINDNNIVLTIVAADTIDGPEMIFAGRKVVRSTEDNPASVGATYDEKYNKFVPEGYVYNPIKQKLMTIEEMEAI